MLRQVQRDVLHVGRRQVLRHGGHGGGIAARAVAHRQLGALLDLEVGQLLDQVFVGLRSQVGIHRDGAVTRRAMTGRTGDDAARGIALVKQLPALGGIWLGRARGAIGGETRSR